MGGIGEGDITVGLGTEVGRGVGARAGEAGAGVVVGVSAEVGTEEAGVASYICSLGSVAEGCLEVSKS